MRGRPWHPALVHFPVACWILATLVDVVAKFRAIPPIDNLQWASMSQLLLWAGVLLAVPTAAAGLRDYLRLPDELQASRELFRHIILMGSAALLFLVAALWRARSGAFDSAPTAAMVMLELAGCACLIAGGHYAGVIVFERMAGWRR